MDMLRADRLNRITKAEDAARQLRNQLRKTVPSSLMTVEQGATLADALAQSLQAIRESI